MAFSYPTLHTIKLHEPEYFDLSNKGSCLGADCMYVFGRDLSISIDIEIDIYDIRPCICQGKAPALCQSFQSFLILQVWKWRAFLSLFSLASSSHCSFYLCAFERLLRESDFRTVSTKTTRTKEHQKGKQTEGFIMRRCVWKDGNKELFVNPLQKGTTWARWDTIRILLVFSCLSDLLSLKLKWTADRLKT